MEEEKVAVFYSIIIPTFNADQYIEQCIQSVLGQSYKDFEIIVVNDESKDDTEKIVQNIARYHPAISTEYIPHGGPGAARNAGVSKAHGKYVIFLDADDYWTNPYLLEQLREKLLQREVDIVMFQMDKYAENGKILKKYRKGPFPSNKDYYQLEEVYEILVRDGQVLASSCNKCVRRSLLEKEHITFQEGGLAEDIDWVLQLFSYVKTISFLNNISYAYRRHKAGSVSQNKAGSEYQARMVEDWADRLKRHEVPNERAVSGFLAFEYGICLGYRQYLSSDMKQMLKDHQYLLDYALDKKTRLIKQFHNIFGLNLTCVAVRVYLFLRKL